MADPAKQYTTFFDSDELRRQPRTLLVTGMGRSGTSALASLIEYQGIYLGKAAKNPTQDDRRFAISIVEGTDDYKKILAKRNEEHEIWATKSPRYRRQLDFVISQLRNPMIIIAHRDVVGVSVRNRLADVVDFGMPSMIDYLNVHAGTIERIIGTGIPQLHLSFELLSGTFETAARAIAEFAGVEPRIEGLQQFMEARQEAYLAQRKVNIQPGNEAGGAA